MENTAGMTCSLTSTPFLSDNNNAYTLWKIFDRLIASIISAPDDDTRKRCQQMVPVIITSVRKALRIDGNLQNLSISEYGKDTTPEDIALFRRMITETRSVVESPSNSNK